MVAEKDEANSKSPFWESVERAAREVATWPKWKRAGVVQKPVKPVDEKDKKHDDKN